MPPPPPDAKDVQALPLENSFRLSRVGIIGVKKPVRIHRPGRGTLTLIADISLYVNLPSTQKGSHMSRNMEAVTEVIDATVRHPVTGLEDLAAEICKMLLERHSYATFAEVDMVADYFLERHITPERRSLEPFRLLARATKERGGKLHKRIGVEVSGMTACPCAMETVQGVLRERNPQLKGALDQLPTITHNQRNLTTILLEVPEEAAIEADDLIELAESSMSSPTYGMLKRGDEAEIVIRAHERPMFVEDVVRNILAKILEKYATLPDDTQVTVRSESVESIHKHNAYAERVTTLGELRA